MSQTENVPDPVQRWTPKRKASVVLELLRGETTAVETARKHGLVFASRSYQALVRSYGLTQEFIAPYTPEQNGLCERFIKTFKEECAWLNNFSSIGETHETIAAFISTTIPGEPTSRSTTKLQTNTTKNT